VSGKAIRLFLIVIGVTMAVAAIAFIVRPPEIHWTPPSADAQALARRIAWHPTDWAAASALSEVSLDSRSGDRFLLWRAAYEHAKQLAPDRLDTTKAFARAAFFHWSELSSNDQRNVLDTFAPLLRDQATFGRMARPLFELTGDLTMLHRSHPRNESSMSLLIYLALQNGFFAEYHNLRGELERQHLADFNAALHTASPVELIARFPDPPYHAEAEPMIAALLEELHRRPLDDNPGRGTIVDAIVDYALRHGLGPLDGLEVITRKPGSASVATRIKLARKLGLADRALQLELSISDPRRVQPLDSEWQGLCETDVCDRAWRTIEADHGVALSIETKMTDNVPAYVEIYVDDALAAEGEVGARRDFILPAGGHGTHRVEVVLANPLTRNNEHRRIHIASITTL